MQERICKRKIRSYMQPAGFFSLQRRKKDDHGEQAHTEARTQKERHENERVQHQPTGEQNEHVPLFRGSKTDEDPRYGKGEDETPGECKEGDLPQKHIERKRTVEVQVPVVRRLVGIEDVVRFFRREDERSERNSRRGASVVRASVEPRLPATPGTVVAGSSPLFSPPPCCGRTGSRLQDPGA